MTCNFVAHSLHSGSHTRPCRFLPADGEYRHRQLAGQTAFIVPHRLINGALIAETRSDENPPEPRYLSPTPYPVSSFKKKNTTTQIMTTQTAAHLLKKITITSI